MADCGSSSRAAFILRKPHGGLLVQTQLGAGRSAARQVTHDLHPELVEALLVLAVAPAPGLVEAEEQAAALAVELLQYQGVLLRNFTKLAK